MPVTVPEPSVGEAPKGNVCTRAGRVFAREAIDVAESAQQRGMNVVETAKARLMKVTSWARTLGPAGEELARQMQQVSTTAQRLAGTYLRDLEQVSKMPRAARIAAAKAHYYGTDPSELKGQAREAYDMMSKPFSRILGLAQTLEVQRTLDDGTRAPIEGSGKAYPSILNKEGERIIREAAKDRRSARADEVAQRIVERNVPEVRTLVDGLNPQELRHARTIGLGGEVADASDAARKAGEALAGNMERGYAMLREIHEASMRGVVPYLERTRIELPEQLIEFDPTKALPAFFRRQGLMLAAFRQWGQDMTPLKALLQKIGAENTQGQADLLGNYIALQLGKSAAGVPGEKALLKDLRDYQMLRIFGGTILGPLRNAGQPFTNAVDQPVSAWVRSLKELPPFMHRWVQSAKHLRETIIESGALTSENPLTEFGSGRLGRAGAKAAIVHRSVVEENEFRSAAIGYFGAQENIRRLIEMQGEKGTIAKALMSIRHLAAPFEVRFTGPDKGVTLRAPDVEGPVIRSLERVGIRPEKIAEIRQAAQNASPAELKEMIRKPSALLTHDEWLTAMQRASIDTQFGYEFASRHVFSGQDDSYAVFYMLKNWGIRQLGYIHDHVLKEAALGNAKPLVKLLATTFLLGEVYNVARDSITGREESMTKTLQRGDVDAGDIARAFAGNIADGGAVGILTDLFWGWSNLAFGPIGGSVTNALRAGAHIAHNERQAPTAIKDFYQREFVVTKQAQGVWNRIKAANEAKHERFFGYNRWRDRAFEYTARQDAPTVGDQARKGAVRFLQGTRGFFPTERSLTYEQVASHITGNDVDGAADYIRRLLETAQTPDEKKSILEGLQRAKTSRSPLGPVRVRDRAAFLAQFTPAERAEARRLQMEWERDWERAITLGRRPKR